MRVKCIDASDQPRLMTGAIYKVMLDVKQGVRPGRSEPVAGYVVMLEGDTVAIPYCYDPKRFAAVQEQ